MLRNVQMALRRAADTYAFEHSYTLEKRERGGRGFRLLLRGPGDKGRVTSWTLLVDRKGTAVDEETLVTRRAATSRGHRAPLVPAA